MVCSEHSLEWPVHYKPGVPDEDWLWDSDSNEDDYHADAHQLLALCMPAAKQPLTYLTELNITAYSMQGTLPGAHQLPNLRKLLIQSTFYLEVGFQDPLATISGPSSLHLSGRPLNPHNWDLRTVAASGALEKHGLVLSTTIREPERKCARAQPSSSCIHLRPAGTLELSYEELSLKAYQSLNCRMWSLHWLLENGRLHK